MIFLGLIGGVQELLLIIELSRCPVMGGSFMFVDRLKGVHLSKHNWQEGTVALVDGEDQVGHGRTQSSVLEHIEFMASRKVYAIWTYIWDTRNQRAAILGLPFSSQ